MKHIIFQCQFKRSPPPFTNFTHLLNHQVWLKTMMMLISKLIFRNTVLCVCPLVYRTTILRIFFLQRIKKLKHIYKHPDDVDLVMGLWLETAYNDETSLGGVTVCILAHTARKWMVKDWRWFNSPRNPRKFTAGQSTDFIMREIVKTTHKDQVRPCTITRKMPFSMDTRHSPRLTIVLTIVIKYSSL